MLGICNGFQVLTEAKLLPGALRPNRGISASSAGTSTSASSGSTRPSPASYQIGQVLRMPIAHGEGNFEHFESELDRLEVERLVALRYVSPAGAVDDAWNFNGSARAIAGVTNREGNVFGLMPHPERCAEEVLGNTDGLGLFAGAVRERGAAGGARPR